MTVAEVVEPLVPEGAFERREVSFDTVELREDGDKLNFEGHAAVFDSLSEDLGGFRERIQRGAFRKVLDTRADVAFLFNHNPDNILASTKAGTMELREDPKGLKVTADLAPTTLGKDLGILCRRGDVSKMSFGFNIGKDGEQSWAKDGAGTLIRTIRSFGRVMDVGPVVFAAYNETAAAMRSLVCGIEIVADGEVQEELLREVSQKIHRGELTVTADERAAVDAAFARTSGVSPWMAQRALQAVSQEPELQGVIPGKRATVVFEDAPSGEPVSYRLAARKRRLRAANAVLTEQRGDAAIVHLLKTMIGLAGQYAASDEKSEGDDDVARMKNVLSTLNALLADELAEPS